MDIRWTKVFDIETERFWFLFKRYWIRVYKAYPAAGECNGFVIGPFYSLYRAQTSATLLSHELKRRAERR